MKKSNVSIHPSLLVLDVEVNNFFFVYQKSKLVEMNMDRPKRQNAGARQPISISFSNLIEKEISKKGENAFAESDNDNEYSSVEMESRESDSLDSDFEETDTEAEEASSVLMKDIEMLLLKEEKRKRKKAKKIIVPTFASYRPSEKQQRHREHKKKTLSHAVPFRSSLRTNSIQNSLVSVSLQQQRSFLKESNKPHKEDIQTTPIEPELTQEQLLEEAKITEVENLKSLKTMIEQQEEMLKTRLNAMKFKKHIIEKPMYSFKSTTQVIKENVEVSESVEDYDSTKECINTLTIISREDDEWDLYQWENSGKFGFLIKEDMFF
ncbi:hypothetical protein BB559_004550 [Furculomyces boomerangus]|uniref:Vps72/YL1 N-terminal domain-containing protein n=1 Tax=Furculomyces boomerangus TaxID=61424 RepID=A0A2T9YE36_9FUNG|nr:hypothetical protein BB559_004550 [Furculomyces boomerangus]